MSEWQPIETAPKDQTSIDVWVVFDTFACRVTGVWWKLDENWWKPDALHEDGGCWWDPEEDYGGGGPLFGTPTHWMRIPNPPQ